MLRKCKLARVEPQNHNLIFELFHCLLENLQVGLLIGIRIVQERIHIFPHKHIWAVAHDILYAMRECLAGRALAHCQAAAYKLLQ